MDALWIGQVIVLAVVQPDVAKGLNCTCESYRNRCRSGPVCTGHSCYALWQRDTKGEIQIERACYVESDYKRFCRDRQNNLNYHCCRNASFCADILPLPSVTKPSTKKGNDGGSGGGGWPLIVGIVAVVIIVILGLLTGCYIKRRQRNDKNPTLDIESSGHSIRYNASGRQEPAGADFEDSDMGEIFLMRRTIAKQLDWVEVIGYGRFGQVWHCTYQGMDVAVKCCTTKDENSWKKESFIYQTTMLRHDNVLGFRAADIYDFEGTTRMLLITDYHRRGSLFSVLQDRPLSLNEALTLASSAACGLNHLHSFIHGTKTKPGIAHRDLKSKNVLVKENGEACLCDLGLAVLYNPDVDIREKFEVHNTRVGTKRYMAPEVLTEEISHFRFESFRMADIYSFGLLLWEILSRCQLYDGEDVFDYHEPYYNMVPADPTFEQMVHVVVTRGFRPPIQDSWYKHPVAREMVLLMSSCWKKVPQSRLPALRLWKNLSGLCESSSASVVSNSTTCTQVSSLSNSTGAMDGLFLTERSCGDRSVASIQTSL